MQVVSQYFGFHDDPFGATPTFDRLYLSETHREALASLKIGFHSNRGFTSLIASPGMGKTTLLFRFLEEIRANATTAFVFNTDVECDPRELLGHILRDIGIVPGTSWAQMHVQINTALMAEARAGRRFVVVIDEAQNLSGDALEAVRLLTNFETPRDKLLQIVLSGQPQLSETLMRPSLVQLRQRISTICRINPLSAKETCLYIKHRLELAGYMGESLFTDAALETITDCSQGIPRVINTLCFNSLALCRALERRQVDSCMVAEAIADQELFPKVSDGIQASPATWQIHQARSELERFDISASRQQKTESIHRPLHLADSTIPSGPSTENLLPGQQQPWQRTTHTFS